MLSSQLRRSPAWIRSRCVGFRGFPDDRLQTQGSSPDRGGWVLGSGKCTLAYPLPQPINDKLCNTQEGAVAVCVGVDGWQYNQNRLRASPMSRSCGVFALHCTESLIAFVICPWASTKESRAYVSPSRRVFHSRCYRSQTIRS